MMRIGFGMYYRIKIARNLKNSVGMIIVYWLMWLNVGSFIC